jgi:hypothetical protein
VELQLRLAELFDDVEARDRAAKVVNSLAPAVARYPLAFGHMLACADMLVNGAVELAIVGEPASAEFRALATTAAERYVPSLVIAGGASRDETDVALLRDREAVGGAATAYVCRNYACELPAQDAATLGAQLEVSSRRAALS